MSEIDEKDLEQAAGGADSGLGFTKGQWYDQNCLICTIKYECRTAKKMAAMEEAVRQAQEGVFWYCPDKC